MGRRAQGGGGTPQRIPTLVELWSDLDPDATSPLYGVAMGNDTARTEQGTLYRVDIGVHVSSPTPGEYFRAVIYNDEDGDIGTTVLARSAPVPTSQATGPFTSFGFAPFVLPPAYHVALWSLPEGETGQLDTSDDAKEVRRSDAVPVVTWITAFALKKIQSAGWGVAP